MTSKIIYPEVFCAICRAAFRGDNSAPAGHFKEFHPELHEFYKLATTKVVAQANKARARRKREQREREYLKNALKCKGCGEDIPFFKINRNPEFCCHRCASDHNVHTTRRSAKVEEYDKNPKLCTNCNKKITYGAAINGAVFCSKGCSRFRDVWVGLSCKKCGTIFNSQSWRKYCTECEDKKARFYEDTKFRFNPLDYDYIDGLELIEQRGWFHPQYNSNGVSKDHRVSVHEAFENGYDPKHIAHPKNCEILTQSENSSKRERSSISYIQLVEEIELLDE
jgi:hypothetical protein